VGVWGKGSAWQFQPWGVEIVARGSGGSVPRREGREVRGGSDMRVPLARGREGALGNDSGKV
jgi:hypothetical protein